VRTEIHDLTPDTIAATVGSVRIELNSQGLGRIWIDGREVRYVKRVSIDAEAGRVAGVKLEVYAMGEPVVEAPCPT